MVQLVFVNDTPRKRSSDLQNKDAQKHQVRSHAATYAHRKKRAERALHSEALPSDRQRHSSFSSESNLSQEIPSFCTTPELTSSSAPASPRSSLSPLSLASPASSESSNIIIEEDDKPDIKKAYISALLYSDYESNLLSNDFGCYRGMRNDPFGQIAARAYPLVDYFTQRVVPSLAATFKIFNINNWTPHDFLRLVQNDDYFYAISSSTQFAFDVSRSPDEPFSQKFLTNHNIALLRLRRRLARQGGKADSVVILAVIALAITAGVTGDLEAHRTHVRSLPLLVRSCGGIDALGHDGFVRAQLKQWETAWSLTPQLRITESSHPSRHDQPYFPSYPFSSRIEQLVNKLPGGFQRLAREGVLSIKTLDVLARTTDAYSNRDASGFKADERDHYHHAQRPYDDWREACPALTTDNTDAKSVLETMIAQALFLHCMHTFSPIRFMGLPYTGFRAKLSSPMMIKHEEGNSETEDVMVWIWLNLIDSWRVENGWTLLPEGVKLMQRLQAKFPGLDGLISLLSRLVLFFTNPVFERRCMTYWHAVEA